MKLKTRVEKLEKDLKQAICDHDYSKKIHLKDLSGSTVWITVVCHSCGHIKRTCAAGKPIIEACELLVKEATKK